MERRTHSNGIDFRSAGEGLGTARGYASVFNARYDVGGQFVEEVRDTAFRSTIAQSDIRALFNHDQDLVLGRNKSGTLRMANDTRGLSYEIDLPNTTLGRDTAELLSRGDIDGSSFGFYVPEGGDEWGLTEDGAALRSLVEVGLRDVGPVTFPQSPHADAGMRALEQFAETRSIDLEEVKGAIEARSFADLLAPKETVGWRPIRRAIA